MEKGDTKMVNPLDHALQTFEKTTKSPTDYLKEQKVYAGRNRLLLKSLFDYANISGTYCMNLPNEIYVNQMDEEQIWQQLEMQNDSFWEKCMNETCRLLSLNENKLTLKLNYPLNDEKERNDDKRNNYQRNNNDSNESQEEDNEDESNDVGDGSDSNYDENNDEDEDEDEDDIVTSEDDSDDENKNKTVDFTTSKNNSSLIVDDQFFKLSEMEAFLDDEDKKEIDRLNGKRFGKLNKELGSDNSIDYFDSLSDNENSDDDVENRAEEKGVMFANFFDSDEMTETPEQSKERKRFEREAKNRRQEQHLKEDLGLVTSEDEDGGSDGDGEIKGGRNDAKKSENDLRQQRMRKRIEELEEKAIADKPWQLKGEINSSTRPKNSLLEEVLEFDSVTRPPPLITEETTLCLEDIIKRRIKSKAWDDVERKIKPINDQQNFRKNLVLQQEKSKESLAQIYEKEYLEKLHKSTDIDAISKPDEPQDHIEIRLAMKDLFIKLDALSNFHFTSKPVSAEVKIITNIPVIEMEEVAPVAISDAKLLAPEEIRARDISNELGKTERTASDKKRERRKKKLKQKLTKKQNDKRVEEKEILGIRVTSKEKQQQLLSQATKNKNVTKSKNSSSAEKQALKSSKTFFTQLQDNVSTTKSKSVGKTKSSSDNLQSSAKRFKL